MIKLVLSKILHLHPENIDLESGLMVIDHALVSTKSKGVYEGETKNGRIRHNTWHPRAWSSYASGWQSGSV